MKKILLFLFFILLHKADLFAQYYTNENKVWAFGANAGVNFISGIPVAFSAGMNTGEGCASVSNPSGSLLFYSNGKVVYNRLGVVMPSGSSIVSFNTTTSTQGALIVPVSGNANQYYLFSLEQFGGAGVPGTGQLAYSIVDMTLAGGNGDLVSGSVGIPLATSLSDKMIAIAGNNCNIWVITHRRDSAVFWAYDITAAGISAPVVSAVGSFSGPNSYVEGVLKASPNRQKIVSQVDDVGGTELYDFNPATGMVSNCRVLDSAGTNGEYGAEFSPDNTKLYTSQYPDGIWQYDLTFSATADIIASQTAVATGGFGDLKLGPDGKIYIANSTIGALGGYLGCIPFPDTAGTGCGYNAHAVILTAGAECGGLPNLVISIFSNDTVYTHHDTTVCIPLGGITITAHDTFAVSDYVWNDGTTDRTHNVTAAGNFWVRIYNGCGMTTDTIKVTSLPPVSITGTTVLCPGAATTLNASTSGGTWSSGDATIATIDSISGMLTAIAQGVTAISYISPSCPAVVTITVDLSPAPITGPAAICTGMIAALSDGVNGGTWSISNTAVATLSATGVITGILLGSTTITYAINAGCIPAATIINVYPPPSAISGTASVCGGATTTLSDAVTGGAWSSANTGVATVGINSGIVTGGSVSAIDTVSITYTAIGGCTAISVVTVKPQPAPVSSGAGGICAGAATTLSDAVSGGIWSSTNTAAATVAPGAAGTGLVTGASPGMATINYTLSSGCGTASATVTVYPLPSAISGTGICSGATATLSEVITGGTWSSSNTGVATVDSITGIITGENVIAAGISTITYTAPGGCTTAAAVTVNPLPAAISSGAGSICAGAAITLSDAISGGSWSSSNTAIATVNSGTGIVTGGIAGAAIIIYSLHTGCGPATVVITVNPLPPAIGGVAGICGGTTRTLNDAVTGGSWSSSNTFIATADPALGLITGGGVSVTSTSTITYTAPDGCTTATTVTVVPQPSSVTGYGSLFCAGTTMSLSDGVGGGVWSSSNTTVATVGSAGIVAGLLPGSATITYTTGASCTAAVVITINASPSAITGSTHICSGVTAALSDAITGGTWSSNNPPLASINPATGIITTASSSLGTAIISYTLGNGCAAAAAITVNITPVPISGTVALCGAGSIAYLSDGIAGGTWSSGSTAVATVDASGAVYGAATGTSAIFYTYGSCSVTVTVTVEPVPLLISGSSTICLGLTTVLSDLSSGGAWSSSNTAVATVNSAGSVTTVSTGSATIVYTLPGGCATAKTITVGTSPAPITGIMKVCSGSVTALTDASGGVWSSSNTTVATVGPSSGIVGGIINGTATITYSLGASCIVTAQVTVNPLPSAITGTAAVCAGSATALTDGGGGSWSSSNTLIATVAAVTGAAGGVLAGTASIIYSLSTGCTTTETITVNPLPVAISGTLDVCAGTTTGLTDASPGGAWASGTTGIATIGSAGVVTAVLPGVSTITYTLGTGCKRTAIVTVNALPAAITGTMNVCAGAATALSDATSGGTWSTAAGTIATTGPAPGMVTGLSAGAASVSYTLGTGCLRTATVTVNPQPTPISGPTAVCAGATMTEADALTGGSWSSSVTTVATIGTIAAGTSLVTGVTIGTTVITYTSTAGCKAATTITVSLAPTAISGTPVLCAGDTAGLSNSAGGGLWSSGNTAAAIIGSLTGTVTGVAAGTAIITYSLGTGCTVTKVMTVNPAPAVPIATGAGLLSLCAGSVLFLNESSTGGAWSTPTGGAATVSATGMVTGVSAGTSMISYTIAATGCIAGVTVTVDLTPSAITGTSHVCSGAAIALSDGVGGGTWASSNIAAATVDTTGLVTGMAQGLATITYSIGAAGLLPGCATTEVITVNPVSAISGPAGVCVGATTDLSDAVTGGIWSSSTTSVVTVNAATGVVTALFSGTSAITYTTAAGCSANATVIVNIIPSAISGALHVCMGDTTTLGNAAGGGTWTSSNTAAVTVITATGTITGVAPGTAVITYSLGTGCTVTAIVTVNPLPMPITGIAIVCEGSTTTFSDATGGGAWSSGNTTIAVVTGTGVVAGISGGTAIITYTPGTGCYMVKQVTVNSLPSPITGSTNVCAGLTMTLSDAITGGVWTSNNPGLATADPVTGVVTGVAPGPVTITYTLSLAGSLPGCVTTATVIINPVPSPISGNTAVCIGSATALSDPSGSGAWTSSNTGIATVTAGGIVNGVAVGTSMVSYTVGTCPATIIITVNSLPGIISGSGHICAGSATILTDLPGDGVWSTSNTATANVDAVTGTLTGIAPGTAVISYSVGAGCTVYALVTVNPLPPPVTGIPAVCSGYTTTLSDPSGGGVWSSDNTAVATITAGGVVHGLAGGGAIISYTNGAGGCAATRVVSVTLVPAIMGISNLCAYSASVHLTDSLPGGNWTSTLVTVSSSGTITPYSTGVATVTYTLPTGCFTSATLTVNALPAPVTVTGLPDFCTGLAMAFNDATTGGIWSSSNTAVASVTPVVASSMVTGLSGGTAIISYTLPGGCSQTIPITIESLPSAGAITGPSSVCAGSAITLSDIASGGTWSSSNISASVSGGIVSEITTGTDTIKYTNSNICGTAVAIKIVTVHPPLPAAGTITGPATLCAGDSIVLADAASGGVWSSSNISATVSGGVVRGISGGTDTIMYAVSNSCGTVNALQVVTVDPLPDPGTISGIDTICTGISFTLLDTVAAGVWSSSNTTVSITGSGLISAISAGVDTITYSVTNMCGTASAGFVVAVNTVPGAIAITGPANICTGAKDTLTGTPPGGVWNSSNTNAVVAAGIISGISPGADTVIYTVSSACGPAVALYPVIIWSISQCDSMTEASFPSTGSGQEMLRVWPNPNDGQFTVLLSSVADEPVHIIITNLVGEKVKGIITVTNKATEIKLNNAAGVYFINASTGTGNYVAKVVFAQ